LTASWFDATRGQAIACDNGLEPTSKALFFWGTRVRLHFIQPGESAQNAFVESLNGKF
jgi:putative transposase